MDVKPVRGGDPPAGLEALGVESDVEIIPAGGLRLGRRWAWLQGAPPRILVSGLDAGGSAVLDGKPVPIGEDGSLILNGGLARPGPHIIEAGRVKRTVEIVAAQVPARREAWTDSGPEGTEARGRCAIALPRGTWTVLGARAGEMAASVAQPGGTIAQCGFEPIWAVRAGAGPGADVVSLCSSLPPPPAVSIVRGRRPYAEGHRWASIIYAASIRRARVWRLDGEPEQLQLASCWQKYVEVARTIKRSLRGVHP